MDKLRIALTVGPVGPRGNEHLDDHDRIWFAVQATAGFEPPDEPTEPLASLWPWNFLLPGDDGKVELRAWLIGKGINPTLTQIEDVEVVPSLHGTKFARALQERIGKVYEDPNPNLDLRLYFPDELPQDEDKLHDLLRWSFPTRLSYLTGIPGELSRRLVANVYLTVKRGDLFEEDGERGWKPKGKLLWIGPTFVHHGERRRHDGKPKLSGKEVPAWVQAYAGGETYAYGPGYELRRYVDPASTPLFDLSTLWLDVDSGDSRFADLESYVVEVMEPLSEARQIDRDFVRGQFLDDDRDLSEDEVRALLQLWRVQALRGLVEWRDDGLVAKGLERLAAHLIREDATEAVLGAVPEDWREPWPSLTEALLAMADRLMVREPDLGQTLRRVSERSELDTVAAWIQETFEAALKHSYAADDESDTGKEELLRLLSQAWELPELKSAGDAADRRTALVQLAMGEALESALARKLIDPVVEGVLAAEDVIDKIREAVEQGILARWTDRLGADVVAALDGVMGGGVTGPLKAKDMDYESTLVDIHLNAAWPAMPSRGRENAGRPMHLVLAKGDDGKRHRVVHEPSQRIAGSLASQSEGVFNEVTGHALLVRRHDDKDLVQAEPWRLVSGGIAAIGRPGGLFEPKDDDETGWCREPLPIAEENVFVQGILRNDRGYDGQLRHIQSPLEAVYAAAGSDGDENDDANEESVGVAYSYQGLGQYKGADLGVKEASQLFKAPPLRFGDWYQFAAAVIDAAGGLPELISQDQPWRLNAAAVAGAQLPAADPLPYRRRQPVGGVSILPSESGEDEDERKQWFWPETPAGVALRVREWRDARAPGTETERDARDDIPTVLLWEGDDFPAPHRPSYRATLEPPSIDEFTLRRWVTPPRGASDEAKQETRAKLIDALTNIYEQRAANRESDGRDGFQTKSAVHDPAVTWFGFRLRVFDLAGRRVVDESFRKELRDLPPAKKLPYRRVPIDLALSVHPAATGDTIRDQIEQDEGKDRIRIALPPSWFGCLEVWPMIAKNDFLRRFDDETVFAGLLERGHHPGQESGFRAFLSNEILFEVADPRLPAADLLHANLALAESAGHVRVTWEPTEEILLNLVDRYELHRERWQWRNRPVLADELEHTDGEGERARLAASGLPRDAFGEKPDEVSALWSWERDAALDRGFVDRGPCAARWPRRTSSDEADAGGVASDVLLHDDAREGVACADFLRYGLTVWSRYAPLLEAGKRSRSARGEEDAFGPSPHNTYRRITVPFQGGRPGPTKVLAAIPLTQPLHEDPLGTTGATPFLVLLDETWFREYGIGERLETRLTLENLDIGETDEETGKDLARPYRTGPLPDHVLAHLKLGDYYPGVERDFDADDKNPFLLEALGPFGYTLDASPDEALASASAFVLHPPKEIGPHWAAYVQFRRVLDFPGRDQMLSEPSDSYALYSLPDSAALAQETGKEPQLLLTPHGDDAYAASFVDMKWNLDPLFGSPGGDQGIPGLDTSRVKARENYRYFLLLSTVQQDASREAEVDIPHDLLRIQEVQGATAGTFVLEQLQDPPVFGNRTSGRVLEVLVNGKYKGPSRLDRRNPDDPSSDLSFRDFWEAVLATRGAQQDAAGTVRRISRAFRVIA